MKKAFVAACCLAVATALSGVATAQDIFVKIAGIEGTSAVVGRGDWTEATSMSEGLSVPAVASSGRASGRPAFAPITLTKQLDAGTLKLREFAATGGIIPQVEIEVTRGDQKATLAYRVILTDVMVQSVNTAIADGSGNVGEESVTLAFNEIRWEFTPFNPKDGKTKPTVKGGWNVTTNKRT